MGVTNRYGQLSNDDLHFSGEIASVQKQLDVMS